MLIPHRPDHGQRDRLFEYVLRAWYAAGVPVFTGRANVEGPFNVAAAFNDAFRCAASWGFRKVAMFGGDHVPQPGALRHAEGLLDGQPWLPLFAHTGGYSQANTEAILRGAPVANAGFDSMVGMCTGILAVRADVWRDVGGMDERFAGWGAEDTAFRAALSTLHGEREPLPGTLGHLWHEPAPRAEATARNVGLFEREYAPAIGNPAAMRAVVSNRE